MRTLHIVMPMAGRGSRYANAGWTTPKPLIEVDGQAMFLKALSSFDGIKAPKRHTIIIRRGHDEQYGLGAQLKKRLPDANIVKTDETPTGATVDAMRAEPFLKPDEGVIVMDCDFWFSSREYDRMVEEALRGKLDIGAGLLTFETTDPRYSFAEVRRDGLVTRTAEKVAISDRGIWGSYFFARAELFSEAARELMKRQLGPDLKEYYISPLYNILLGRGEKVKAAAVDEFGSFGTPEELDKYVGRHVEPS